MSDDIRREEQPRAAGNITTADLAGAGDQRRTADTDVQPVATPAQATEARGSAAASGPGTGTAATMAPQEDRTPLFSQQETNELRARWDSVQVGFVDEPRQAVEEADRLVATTMKRLAEIFTEERQKLEHQWDRGDNVSTEDFRLALRRYRSFFARLLSI